jgi:uncharacterized membrane protein YedE/YeeE
MSAAPRRPLAAHPRAIHLRYAVYGLVFGFGLSRIGFGDFAEVHAMFVFDDLRLFLAFAGGVALTMVGFVALARMSAMPRRHLHPGSVLGGVLFGAGWAITGACPSIVLVQLGGGHVSALATLAGVLAGVAAYAPVHRRWLPWQLDSCSV